MNKKEIINTDHDFDWFKKIMIQIFVGILSILGGVCSVLILYFMTCWIQYSILTFEQCGVFFRMLALMLFWYGTWKCYTFLMHKFLPESINAHKD